MPRRLLQSAAIGCRFVTSPSDQDRERLAAHRTIDLTTYGRRSGMPRRIEIWWFHIDGRFVITGTPGKRDWLANVTARPEVIIHAGGMDLPATVRPISDPKFRRRVFTDPGVSWYRNQAELDRLVAEAPMIEVLFQQLGADYEGAWAEWTDTGEADPWATVVGDETD